MVEMSWILISVLILLSENIHADKEVEDKNIFVSLKPSNISIERVDNATQTTIRVTAKRKAILIINSDPALRSSDKKKKITSLYYQDFDENGKILNTMWMYSLEDVAEFFKVFLDTEICYGQC